MLEVMAKSVLGVRGGGKIWATRCPCGAFRVPFWHHFGVLEAPVAAYWDLLGPHGNHVKGWG